jgi:cobalt/nickel transport system permease protein
VFADEVLRLTRARAARSGQSDLPGAKTGGNVVWRAHITGGMAGNLFLRAFERSDRIYMAMLARGYDGDVRTLPLPAVRRVHWLVLLTGLGLLILLLVLGFLF